MLAGDEIRKNMLLFCGIRALLSPDEGSCYVLSISNNYCEFLASDDVNLQNIHQSIFTYKELNKCINIDQNIC